GAEARGRQGGGHALPQPCVGAGDHHAHPRGAAGGGGRGGGDRHRPGDHRLGGRHLEFGRTEVPGALHVISLRQHAISSAAILLALAIVVVLGSSVLCGNLLSGLTNDKEDLQSQVHDLQSQTNSQNLQLQSAAAFDSSIAGRVVGGTLADRTVVVFTTPSATPDNADRAVALISAAGGTVTGQVGLTDDFVTAQGADQRRATVSNVVPAGVQLGTGAVDPGSMAGGLLGAVLMLDAETAQPQSTPAERDLA